MAYSTVWDGTAIPLSRLRPDPRDPYSTKRSRHHCQLAMSGRPTARTAVPGAARLRGRVAGVHDDELIAEKVVVLDIYSRKESRHCEWCVCS